MPPVRVRLDQPVALEPTLKGGQAFRWRRLAPGASGASRAGDPRASNGAGPGGAPGEAWAGVADGRAWVLRRAGADLWVEGWPDPGPGGAAAWARRYLRLDDDYAAITRRLAADPALGPALAAWPGLRVLRTDPWECLLGFITSIHDSVAAIETRIARLADAFGEPVRVPARAFPRGWARRTPGPERIARARESGLRAAGLGFRAPYLRAAARAVVRGDLSLDRLAARPYAEAHAALLEVSGVGDKVADCVQLYALGHLESFPVDRWVHRAMVRRALGGTARTPPRALGAFARERWGRDAGYAQQFLFHHERLSARAAPPGRGAALKPRTPMAAR